MKRKMIEIDSDVLKRLSIMKVELEKKRLSDVIKQLLDKEEDVKNVFPSEEAIRKWVNSY